MRPLLIIVAMATIPALVGVNVTSAAAQDLFNDRWSIIPKAHAEPAPAGPDQLNKNSQEQAPTREQPTQSSQGHAAARSYNRVFSGKASFYTYLKGKTASGAPFNRDAMTAAHRTLPFGTRVRVIDPASTRSVVVKIVDRGPWIRGRILDLSRGAARALGITDRGVAQVRAEVLSDVTRGTY
jgi:rare lipoprotein A (peptidoglycan hydrolase)